MDALCKLNFVYMKAKFPPPHKQMSWEMGPYKLSLALMVELKTELNCNLIWLSWVICRSNALTIGPTTS